MADNSAPSPQRHRRWLLPVLILAIAGVAAAGLIATREVPAPVEVTERAWLVSAEHVEPGRYEPRLTLFGKAESLWSSELTAGLSADVVEVVAIEGDRVQRGQTLVRLDRRDAQLELAQREAELEQAKARIVAEINRHEANLAALPRERQLLALTRKEVERLRGLTKKKVSAQSQLDTARQATERQAVVVTERQQAVDDHTSRLTEAEAVKARAEALRDQAQLALDRTEVKAPFDGRIAQVMVSPGKRVRTGDPLIRIFSIDDMFVRAQLPNRVLPAVRRALSSDVVLSARGEIDGIPIETRLRGLAADAGAAAGGVDGLFDIVDSQQLPINQGRFVSLELQLPASDELVALPHEAIYGADRIYYIDADSRMRALQVTRIGEVAQGEAVRLLVSVPDLPDAARIVTTQLPNALDGLLVSVVDDES